MDGSQTTDLVSAPELIVQITDSHLRAGPGDDESAAALSAAVAAIGRLEPQPAAVLFTGDIAAGGTPAEYERARELLAPLRMPVHPLAGNHDDRDSLRAAFGDHPGVAGGEGFVHYVAECGPLRVVACDTLKPGTDAGELSAERLEWIQAALAADPERPTILAMHHPPMLTGISAFDEEIGLAPDERRALAEVLARAGGVELIVSGHIHRAIRGSLGPTPVQVCPSVHLQARLDFRPGAPIELAAETPGLAVHVYGADSRLASHIQTIEPGPA